MKQLISYNYFKGLEEDLNNHYEVLERIISEDYDLNNHYEHEFFKLIEHCSSIINYFLYLSSMLMEHKSLSTIISYQN